jgi:hypothetical protein
LIGGTKEFSCRENFLISKYGNPSVAVDLLRSIPTLPEDLQLLIMNNLISLMLCSARNCDSIRDVDLFSATIEVINKNFQEGIKGEFPFFFFFLFLFRRVLFE